MEVNKITLSLTGDKASGKSVLGYGIESYLNSIEGVEAKFSPIYETMQIKTKDDFYTNVLLSIKD